MAAMRRGQLRISRAIVRSRDALHASRRENKRDRIVVLGRVTVPRWTLDKDSVEAIKVFSIRNPPLWWVYNFGPMATYQEIQKCVKQQFGISIKSCWIAHVKELNGLEPRQAHNRKNSRKREVPCPDDKRPLIESCFRRLRMI
jgi:hypothetical protein